MREAVGVMKGLGFNGGDSHILFNELYLGCLNCRMWYCSEPLPVELLLYLD